MNKSKDQWLRDHFSNPEWDVRTTRNVERQMRESRRFWKKTRNKYLRKEGKKDIDLRETE